MEILNKIYYDPSNPGSFGSEPKLYREAHKINPRISHKQVKDFLSGQLPYTLHRRIVRKYKRNPVISTRPGEMTQADLIDLQRYAQSNDGFNYILTFIDVFTKKAWAIPVKNKGSPEMRRGIAKIFDSIIPENLQTDDGMEFKNKSVQNLLKENDVNFFIARNEVIKCSNIERFQRTLMTRIHKYFTANGTHRYIDVLDQFINSYNNTVHRSTKMTPNEIKDEDINQVFYNLYGFENRRQLLMEIFKNKTKLQHGDHVRVPEMKNKFSKGYAQNFTDRIFTIRQGVRGSNRPTYILNDNVGKRVAGKFYPEEVQKINNPDIYRVVIKDKRKQGRGYQYLIEYLNHPEEGQQWIPAARLQKITSIQ